MLNDKIDIAEKKEAKEKAEKEKAKVKRSSSRSSSRSSRQNPIVKVLSSPTVIRSVLGILGKLLK